MLFVGVVDDGDELHGPLVNKTTKIVLNSNDTKYIEKIGM